MDRREVLQSGAATAAIATVVSPQSLTKPVLVPGGTIVVDRKSYPVTDKFQREVFDPYPDLANLSYSRLIDARDRLLQISNARNRYELPMPKEPMAGMLTVREQARLEAVTHVINVHHGVRFLQGRSHTEFGFVGVDQVHGNHTKLACGCVTTVVFDHHRRHEPEFPLYPHYPRRLCEKHVV